MCNRSFFPCFDTPAVKCTYSAVVKVRVPQPGLPPCHPPGRSPRVGGQPGRGSQQSVGALCDERYPDRDVAPGPRSWGSPSGMWGSLPWIWGFLTQSVALPLETGGTGFPFLDMGCPVGGCGVPYHDMGFPDLGCRVFHQIMGFPIKDMGCPDGWGLLARRPRRGCRC